MSAAADNAFSAVPKRRRWGRQTRFLSQSVILEEVGPPRLLRAILLLLGATVAAFLAWAAVTPLAQRVRATGQVVPSGAVVPVQHLEGGIVRQILTHEGALVSAGAALVRLDPAAARAELQEKEARIAALSLQAERLRAFTDGRAAKFDGVGDGYDGLVADQSKILALQQEKRTSQRKVLQSQIHQRRSELGSFENQEQTLKQEIGILSELAEMRRKLYEKGLNSKVLYLGTMQQLVAARGELRRLQSEAARSHQAITEAEGKLVQLDAELRTEAMTQMGQVTGELAQLRQAAERLKDRVTRLQIAAPVRGVVKSLAPNAPGGVIAPGSVVAEIVPLDDELVVEARIEPRDVGQLRPGQPVSVKVSAYEFYRFGDVAGVLDRISASTFQDKDGRVYYKATVTLKKSFVGENSARNPILPGMIAETDINTGERTVLEYLLKPVYVSLNKAFGER
jgi:HlyD family secretion protein/adhesin transport system membrane fusion protein